MVVLKVLSIWKKAGIMLLPKKIFLGELNNIKIENNTIVNNLSEQEITKTRNPKEGNIPESVNETTLTSKIITAFR